MPIQRQLPKDWTNPAVKQKSDSVSEGMQHALDTNSVHNVSVSNDVHDAEKEPELIAKLNYETWLPFSAKVYKISPRIEDYIIVNTLICPSELPNRNGIAFPTAELAAFRPAPTNRLVWEAWAGCPVCFEHDNTDLEKSYGVILDTSFQKVHGFGGGKLWKVMGLLAIDKNKNPDVAKKVLEGKINTYSMGALVDYFTCGYCGTQCNDNYCCSHISSPKVVNWKKYRDFDGSTHLAFLNAHGIQPIECSIVADPAWAPALSDNVLDPFAPDVMQNSG